MNMLRVRAITRERGHDDSMLEIELTDFDGLEKLRRRGRHDEGKVVLRRRRRVRELKWWMWRERMCVVDE